MAECKSRRGFLQAAAALGTGISFFPDVFAQTGWPQAPIQLIVPFSPGGATDVVARALANGLQERLGKSVIVDNRTGAGGSIGTAAVARSRPDGLTLTVGLTSSLLINQFQYRRLSYDPRRDLIFVSQLAIAPMAICVADKLPAKNMAELRQYLAARKGKVAYGSYGNGSYSHLVLEHMNRSLSAGMTHVPYRGETAVVQALLGGEIDLGICSGVVAVPQARTGRIRVVGITGPQRMEALPEVPTLIEQGMMDDAYRVVGWVGMAAPANTPADIIDRLAREAAAVMHSGSVKERLKGIGLVALGNTPQQFKEAYDREFQIWKRMFEASGAKVED
ncbi:tripartite tricarboxylate transporter substrate binding protein [Cupriavidus sp. L7L]|uniref:Bug family tripartite tricarboxylate transporter substrate binding protein n=1 Tax=Cupriavidus sp. L7L TaxID=2546443 RepID=UPI001054F30C|nr:tripartite tricarboxylate transporter substrate binding protein [Cupriavidus sp. L7L]TDF64537.1 tripartite tricarboxylate transporter substrate binding protein [Cupriavidus sp. L7L]